MEILEGRCDPAGQHAPRDTYMAHFWKIQEAAQQQKIDHGQTEEVLRIQADHDAVIDAVAEALLKQLTVADLTARTTEEAGADKERDRPLSDRTISISSKASKALRSQESNLLAKASNRRTGNQGNDSQQPVDCCRLNK